MANSTIVYAGTEDGLAIFNKPGTLPEWLPPRRTLQGQRITSVWAEPGPPIRVLAIADGVLLHSENGGRTWDAAGPEAHLGDVLQDDLSEQYSSKMPEGALAFVVIPGGKEMPPALVAGTADGLQVSSDGGAAWTQVSLPHDGTVTALARDPERRDRLYAATDTGYLFESGNRGHTWQAANALPVDAILAICVVRI